MMRRIAVLAALVFCSGAFPEKARAASLEISPVLINLAPRQTSATIEVLNRGGESVAIQARAFVWSQTGDEDALTPTKDVIVSPPIFTIPEGSSQTIRLLLRNVGAGADGREHSYRLLLDEVPAPDSDNKQLVVALRLSIPIMAHTVAAVSTLKWRMEHARDGQIVLKAINTGNAYALVSAMEVTLSDGSHPKTMPVGKNPYVLPGAERRWVVEGRSPPGALRLNLTTQVGRTDQTLAQ
jgi:fimbrial chaperone protein